MPARHSSPSSQLRGNLRRKSVWMPQEGEKRRLLDALCAVHGTVRRRSTGRSCAGTHAGAVRAEGRPVVSARAAWRQAQGL